MQMLILNSLKLLLGYILRKTVLIFKKTRTVLLALKDQVREELDCSMCSGVLEEIDHSEWAAPITHLMDLICADCSTGFKSSLRSSDISYSNTRIIVYKTKWWQKNVPSWTCLMPTFQYLSKKSKKKLLFIKAIIGLIC